MSGTPPPSKPDADPSSGETPGPQPAPASGDVASNAEGPVLAEKPALKIPDPIPEPLATVPSIPPPVTPPPEPVVAPAYTAPATPYQAPSPSGGGKPPGLMSRMRGEHEDDGGPRMSFIDHLMELRKRLWVSIVTIVVSMVAALAFYDWLFAILRKPLDDVNNDFRLAKNAQLYADILERLRLPANSDVVQLTSINLLGTMMMVMWIGIGAGLVLSSPIVIYEVWAFISPGLKDKEKNAIKPVLYGGVLFFLAGVALTYYLLFPVTLDFVVWLDVQPAFRIRPSYTVDEYLSLLLNMMWITGLICETPLVVGALAKFGLVKASQLLQYWRICVLASFIMGSIFSPGTDVMSMLVFSLLLLSLYIVSIFMAWFFYPKQKT